MGRNCRIRHNVGMHRQRSARSSYMRYVTNKQHFNTTRDDTQESAMNNNAMDQLVSQAEELLSKLQDASNPEIRRLRAKVESGIAQAKSAASDQVQLGAEKLRQVTGSVVEYVQENPWVAVAAGTAIAVALLYMAFSRSTDDD